MWIIVIIMSMLPFLELRASIPLGILAFGLPPLPVFAVAVLSNMLVIPVILLLFERVEEWLRRYRFWSDLMDRVFEKTRKRASSRVEKYEALALILFVGIPLPGTGAWTGSLVAYLFGMDIRKSFFFISAGVLLAGISIFLMTVGALRL
jgi:uncharacterized membrane protein